eukprot:11220004-Lingulodinium_polyedra.AAC.1
MHPLHWDEDCSSGNRCNDIAMRATCECNASAALLQNTRCKIAKLPPNGKGNNGPCDFACPLSLAVVQTVRNKTVIEPRSH